MRRFLTTALVLGLLLGAMSTPAGARPTWRQRTIRYESFDGRAGYSRAELVKTAYRATVRFHPIGNWRMVRCIIARESGWNPGALNPSDAGGMLQIRAATWAGWYARFAQTRRYYHVTNDRMNPRNNLIIGLRAMHDSLSPWGGWCG